MMKKVVVVLFALAIIAGGILLSIRLKHRGSLFILSPIELITERVEKKKEPLFPETINILLLGTDTSINRRNKGQGGFNTDTMILISANTRTNRILLTSVPRDLWINGNKINALHVVYGEDTLLDAFEQVTGLDVQEIIRADFDQFVWLADSFGGIPVTVERSFSDYSFPNFTDTDVLTVSFTAGEEKMTGERALTFARSRKGTNGEGSDLMRAKRQHLLLEGMVEAIKQPGSIFWPMDVDNFYSVITSRGIYTTLTLNKVRFLWDFYKDKDRYEVESFVVDGTYVYHPGMYPQSDYHAWVFVPLEPGFANLHADIKAKLEGTFEYPSDLNNESDQNENTSL